MRDPISGWPTWVAMMPLFAMALIVLALLAQLSKIVAVGTAVGMAIIFWTKMKRAGIW